MYCIRRGVLGHRCRHVRPVIGEESPWRAPRRSSTGPNPWRCRYNDAPRARYVRLSGPEPSRSAESTSRTTSSAGAFRRPITTLLSASQRRRCSHGLLPLADHCSRAHRAQPTSSSVKRSWPFSTRKSCCSNSTCPQLVMRRRTAGPRSHVSLGGQLPHRALWHGSPRQSAPILPLSHQRASRPPPPGCPPCFSALSLGHPFSNHSAPVAGFHWFRARRRGEVPPPPLSATVGAAVRRRRQERRHVACCCANGQAFCSRSGSKNAARRHLRAPCDSAVAPSRPPPTPTPPQSPPPTAPAPTARGPMGRGPMGCGPIRRQPSAPCQPLSVPPPPCGGEVPRIM